MPHVWRPASRVVSQSARAHHYRESSIEPPQTSRAESCLTPFCGENGIRRRSAADRCEIWALVPIDCFALRRDHSRLHVKELRSSKKFEAITHIFANELYVYI